MHHTSDPLHLHASFSVLLSFRLGVSLHFYPYLHLSITLCVSPRIFLIVHRRDTVALLRTCFPCRQTCQTHLTILPTHSRGSRFARKQSCI